MTGSDENSDSERAVPAGSPDSESASAETEDEAGDDTRLPGDGDEPTGDRPLVYGLGTAVGTFVVFGVGLVLTSFFVVQFGGAGDPFGAPFFGSGGGLGFAVLLSPVVAVLLGVVLGRSDATALDAAAATGVGFGAMYLATALVAGSLYSPEGGPGLGPLAGFAVGVVLVSGLTAAVADRDLAVSAGGIAVRRPAAFGAAVLATYAVGVAVAAVLSGALAGPQSGVGMPREAFAALPTRTMLSFGLLFLPAVGLLAGYLGTPDDATERTAAAGGATAGAVGAVVALLVLYGTAVATGPGGPFPAGGLVGLAVGTAATAAGAAVVAARE